MLHTNLPQMGDWDRLAPIQEQLAHPERFPLRYTYREEQQAHLPAGTARRRRRIDANLTETVWTARVDETLTVRAECLEYADFPVAEWTVYFENTGAADSGLLEDVLAADLLLSGEQASIVCNNGDFYRANGYSEIRKTLAPGEVFEQAPQGGRPCDQAFPYQRVLFDSFGYTLSIGWPGQWSCRYTGAENGLRFAAGQQTVHTVLHPGESLRTPRMTFMAFEGGEQRGINLWRRWYNAHILPRKDGKPLEPHLVSMDNNGGIEFTLANEENQLKGIDKIHKLFPEVNLWWIDAGWYPCWNEETNAPEWGRVGTWTPDPARFPRGFAPIGEACRKAGMDLLVWFEPERVFEGSQLATEHPDWVLHRNEPSQEGLLNLANPDAHKWLRESIANLLKTSGITCYRQDFNFEPLQYWRDNEPEDRQGMLENLYVQGYLAYWDHLLETVPGLWIDSCASGGRRNDLETMRRAVPLHPTDYGYGYHHINQAFRHTLCAWLPYTRSWNNSWDHNGEYPEEHEYYAQETPTMDNFKLLNGFGVLSMLVTPAEVDALPDSVPLVQKLARSWSRFAWYQLNGDFYPLTPEYRDNTHWTVFQFNSPERRSGALQALRNNQCKEETLRVQLQGLDPDAEYVLENPESAERLIRSGKELAQEGLLLAQPMRSGAIWFYHERCKEGQSK